MQKRMTHRMLLCPPTYFGVDYSINPWMKPGEVEVDGERAQNEWNALRRIYEEIGVELLYMEPQPGLPDMVYVDVGVIWGKIFIPSNFKCPERQGERPHIIQFFQGLGYEIVELPEYLTLEGHGDTLWDGDTLYCGHGFRTDLEAHAEVERILRGKGAPIKTVSVELVDPRLYHLDTTFCPLGNGTGLIYRKGVTKESFGTLVQHMDLISVSEEEALNFACNAVVTGKHVIIPTGAPRTCRQLRNRGFTVHEVAMREFIKGGGAAKCLSMPLS